MNKPSNWHSPEWLASVQHWTNESLLTLDIQPIGNLQKVSGWALGQIFKQNTNKGFYFFKATAFLPLFSNESALCVKLSELLPEYIPETIYSSNVNQWMLSKDFGGGLPEDAAKELWAKAFQRFASLQQHSIKHIDVLIINGCLTRHITDIPEQLNNILNDDELTQYLPERSQDEKEKLIFKLKETIDELESFNIPNTIVHGDLHIENIAQINDRFIFFDWSDACISHPFIDGTYIFRMPEGKDKESIVTAYLKQWTNFATLETLKTAWHKAELICYAHQAISYASMKKTLTAEQMKDLEQALLNAFNRMFSSYEAVKVVHM